MANHNTSLSSVIYITCVLARALFVHTRATTGKHAIYITRVLDRALFVHTRATTESEYGQSRSFAFAQLNNVAPYPFSSKLHS